MFLRFLTIFRSCCCNPKSTFYNRVPGIFHWEPWKESNRRNWVPGRVRPSPAAGLAAGGRRTWPEERAWAATDLARGLEGGGWTEDGAVGGWRRGAPLASATAHCRPAAARLGSPAAVGRVQGGEAELEGKRKGAARPARGKTAATAWQ
jgi:hypothetical protein